MINEITCDTPISALLNVETIESLVASYSSECTKCQEKLIADITYEQTSGGLSSEAFTMDEVPITYNESEKSKRKILELEEIVSSWKSQVLSAAEEQYKQEKMKLITEVSNKIEKLESTLISLQQMTLLSVKINDKNPNAAQIENIQAQLKQYREKYLELLLLK